MRILIVGGAGEFGSFYARLFSKNGFKVSICDKDEAAGETFCKKNNIKWNKNCTNLKEFDTVIVCIPNKAAPKVIEKIGPKLGKGALLVDFCSVKTEAVKELKKLSKLDLELASIHPMHGPRVKTIVGRPIVCIPIKQGKKLEEIEKFFAKKGSKIILSTAKEHDRLLSIVQGLTHYSQFISAAVLKNLCTDLKESVKFGSPNYHLFLSLMSRVILQNPELYSQIQMGNKENKKIWKLFREKSEEFEKICNKNDSEKLKKKIIESAQQFKEHESILYGSDRAVNAINYIVETVRHHIGKRFMVENIITGKMHYGKITGIENQTLIIDEQGKKTRISLSHVRLTSKEEMKKWRKQNLKPMHLDYSFLVSKECDKEIIKKGLSHIKFCSIKILDEYKSNKLPKGKKSITIKATFFEDDGLERIDELIRKTITGLGFSFR